MGRFPATNKEQFAYILPACRDGVKVAVILEECQRRWPYRNPPWSIAGVKHVWKKYKDDPKSVDSLYRCALN